MAKRYKYAVGDKKINGRATWRYFVNEKSAKKFANKMHHIVEPISSKKAHQKKWGII